jgi:hypothetical protein
MTQNNLSDIAQSLNELNINDNSIRNTIGDLIEVKKKQRKSSIDFFLNIFVFKG